MPTFLMSKIQVYFSKIIKAALEENATPLTPRKTSEIDQMARTPESPRATYPDSGDSNPPKPTGLTPRKEKLKVCWIVPLVKLENIVQNQVFQN